MFEAFYDFDLTLVNWGNAALKGAGVVLTPLFRAITFLGELGWFFVVASLFLLLFRKTRRAGAVAIVAIALGAVFSNLILKNAVARPRPFADENSPFYELWVQAGGVSEGEYSFPSGHATASMAFAVALVFTLNKKVSWLALLIPLVMGFTRIYFVVHFASDVLFGYLVGACCAVAAWVVVKLLARWKLFANYLEAEGIVDLVRDRKARKKKVEQEK